MTLRHLKIFVAVCETGSATAAGARLYIAQPSVSHAIVELEEYYGIQLFDRIGKRLHLTEAGKHFLQYATHIVSLFDDMEKEIRNFDAIGVLRVGASITIGNHLLPDYITEFKKFHPQMDVQAVVDNTDKIQQYVLSNRVDVGLIEGEVPSQYLVVRKFREDRLVWICANAHPFAGQKTVELPQLQRESVLLREAGSAGREIFDSMMVTRGLSITPAWESTSTQAIIHGVQANLGVSLLPYLLVKEALDRREISLFCVRGVELAKSFCVVHHRNKFLTESAKDFIALCQSASSRPAE